MTFRRDAKLIRQVLCDHPRSEQTNFHLSDPLAPRWCNRCGLKLGGRRYQRVKLLKNLNGVNQ